MTTKGKKSKNPVKIKQNIQEMMNTIVDCMQNFQITKYQQMIFVQSKLKK